MNDRSAERVSDDAHESVPFSSRETDGPGADEPVRSSLDPDVETMRRQGYAVVDWMVERLAGLSERPVSQLADLPDMVREVDEPLPRGPGSVEDAMAFFHQRIEPRMTSVDHPRFHAYIPCPSSFYAALGSMLATGSNAFVGSWLGGGSIAALEEVVLRWIAEAIGFDATATGSLTSGGSVANLIGIAAARARAGHEVLREGVLYLSEESHGSVEKAARVLGFASEQIRLIPVDDEWRMDVAAAADAVRADRAAGRRPFFLCATAGTTNTGAVDPLNDLADLCAEEGLWFHVDGAYGGFAALSPTLRPRFEGMQRADSLTLDPHKWLFGAMGCGCSLVRDAESLGRAFHSDGGYLRDVSREQLNYFDRGPELSRPARVLGTWMLMRCAGVDELSRQVEWDLSLAAHAAERLGSDPRLEVLEPPQLSIFAFRHRARPGEDDAQREARDLDLVRRLREDGGQLLSSTRLRGTSAIRFVVMNHRSSRAEVDRTVDCILRLAELASDRASPPR